MGKTDRIQGKHTCIIRGFLSSDKEKKLVLQAFVGLGMDRRSGKPLCLDCGEHFDSVAGWETHTGAAARSMLCGVKGKLVSGWLTVKDTGKRIDNTWDGMFKLNADELRKKLLAVRARNSYMS